MEETIKNYCSEASKIAEVISKLLSTQNVDVFENIFHKLSDLVDNISSIKSDGLNGDNRRSLINCLYNLKDSALKLADFYKYLKEVFNKDSETNTQSVEPVSTISKQVDNKILSLTNENERVA